MKNISQRINNPDYKWWVVKDGKITSGWEYMTDAQDWVDDNGGKVRARKGLKLLGLNPDNNEDWSK